MNDEPVPPGPGDADDEDHLDRTDDDLGDDGEAEGRVERRPLGRSLSSHWDFALGDMLRDITKTFRPKPLVNEIFLDSIRASKPFEDSLKNALKIEDLVKTTYDLGHLSDAIEALKPKYEISWIGDVLAARNNGAFLNLSLAEKLAYRPPLLEIPPVVAGAMYNDFDVPVEGRVEGEIEAEETGSEEEDAGSLVELVRRNFDTGELSDTEIDSVVQQGVAEYQSLDEDQKSIVSAVADLMEQLHKNDQIMIAQTGALIKFEEQKFEAANKRAEEAERREKEADDRARRAENRDKVALGLAVGSLVVTALSVVVALLALAAA